MRSPARTGRVRAAPAVGKAASGVTAGRALAARSRLNGAPRRGGLGPSGRLQEQPPPEAEAGTPGFDEELGAERRAARLYRHRLPYFAPEQLERAVHVARDGAE